MTSKTHRLMAVAVVVASVLLAAGAGPARVQLQVLLPLGRTAYQSNEWIDVSAVRSGKGPLAAGKLTLTLADEAGSKMTFTFPVEASKSATATEHLHVNGRLLRPGRYTLTVAADGQTATQGITVHSHLRKSTFKLINWGRARTAHQKRVQGEDSLGYNLIYGHYTNDNDANYIRGGVDFMANCTMSGAHQMDLRLECDWSDPSVTRGGTVRVVRRALSDRTRPNVYGVHFYDEPGLTWLENPRTGEVTPHMIPAQVRAFRSAFAHEPLWYNKVDPNNPEHVKRWFQWARWKLGFMDSAWKEASFGVSRVRPDYLSVTQSQYGWTAFTDGYYFNVARSLPVVSGHGGYDDYGAGYFNPSFTLEGARARDFAKPEWYLPTWYGNTPSDRFRLEQYLSFQTNLEGMISPPDLDPAINAGAREGIVESNKLMARLGTIFTTMPVTRPPVAMLYSLSNCIDAQTRDMKGANYAHAIKQGRYLAWTYLAGKRLQRQFMFVLDEDVVDGTLAANHKAVILTGVDYLSPEVVAGLETFAADGGRVLMTGCTVKVKGAVDLGVVAGWPDADRIRALQAEAKGLTGDAAKAMGARLGKLIHIGKQWEGAAKLAAAIQQHLDKAGMQPVFDSSEWGIVATRQVCGDIEYLFAVNAAFDFARGVQNEARAVEAKIALPDDGRPIYDAVNGGLVEQFKAGKGTFRFGPGQMRVWARTTRPIGSIRLGRPLVVRDFTVEDAPIRVELSAALTDEKGGFLSGSAPLHVKLIDPLGDVRYDLYRATKDGSLRLRLPLAANDPPGQWKIIVKELLANTTDEASFAYRPAKRCGAMAGTTRRAVYFGRDRDNIFRFARLHHDVTVVTGSSEYNTAAAARVKKTLAPWGVRCKIVPAAKVNKAKRIPDEALETWVGLSPARLSKKNRGGLDQVGFAVEGSVILLGNPKDNPLIAFASKRGFLPYAPDPERFPGRGRGYIAWQRDAVGHGQESITLIAYDAEGMAEAVGSMYEAVHGLDPLTQWALPAANTIAPANKALQPPALAVAWDVIVPDRVTAMTAGGGNVAVLTHDGTVTRIDANGKVASAKVGAKLAPAAADAAAMAAAKKAPAPNRILKCATAYKGMTAIAYWGGTLRVVDADGKVRFARQMSNDIGALAVLDGKLIVGVADGRVVALEAK